MYLPCDQCILLAEVPVKIVRVNISCAYIIHVIRKCLTVQKFRCDINTRTNSYACTEPHGNIYLRKGISLFFGVLRHTLPFRFQWVQLMPGLLSVGIRKRTLRVKMEHTYADKPIRAYR